MAIRCLGCFLLLTSMGWGQAVQSIAISEGGFGVGRILIPAGQIASDATVRILTTEQSGRILYPAIEIFSSEPAPEPRLAPQPGQRRIGGGVVVQRLRHAIDRLREHIDPPEYVRVHFLFTGTEPLQLSLSGDIELSLALEPIVRPERLNKQPGGAPRSDPGLDDLLRGWWRGYVQQAQRQVERSDYPSLIERYLVQMLGHRFQFDVPDLLQVKSKKGLKQKQTDPTPTLSLLAGVESLRDEISQQIWDEPFAPGGPRLSVPIPPAWSDHPIPELPADIAIESIAFAVPEDCFYIRFGSFANYLWFQRVGESRAGDLAQLALLRGFNYQSSERIERMLNTRMTAVSKLFGDSVISDMAIVGYDLYMHEGPSMGVVFEAKNFALLRSSLEQERTATARRLESQGCQLQTIEIEGQAVSLLSTPDNSIRSFAVPSEPFYFLTTSRELAKRFLQVRNSQYSLADSPAFRYARWMMPMENQYDVFAYFSSPFLRNLVSPQYQIELRRRLHAIAAIETAELASLVDAAEQRHGFQLPMLGETPPPLSSDALPPPKSVSNEIDRWIANGYLPPWFQRRIDGSETLRFADAWHDSVRGRRGSFLPIADTPVVDCSPEEAAIYQASAEFYADEWQQTDPLMFGLRRFAHPELPKVERLAIESYIAPLGSEKYGWLGSVLAPPLPTQVEHPPDDVVNVQVRLAGLQSDRFYAEDHFLFAGIKDLTPPLPEETKGLLAILRMLKSLPAYIGSWPKAGYLDRLPLGLGGGPPDFLGFSKTLFGIWRWQMGGFSVIAFDRSILESCAMYLKVAPAQDYAQGRMRVRDLSKSQLSGWFNTLSFRKAAQTTRGNLLLLDSIQQQLGVDGDQARDRAERLLDAKLQCTLGGEFQWDGTRWITTAWPESIALAPNTQASTIGFDSLHTIAPSNYLAPWLQWFRGAQLHLTQLPERLVVVGEIDMEPLPPPPKNGSEAESALPSLPPLNIDIYNLPFQFFQKDKPSSPPKEKQNAAPGEKRKF
jgi:hypothetical protein